MSIQEEIDNAIVQQGYNITQLETNGYILTNGIMCSFGGLILLKHLQHVYCDNLTDEQAENVIHMRHALLQLNYD